MTVREAAEKLEVSQSLVYRLIAERRLGCVRIGQEGKRGAVRIRPVDLEEFLRQCRNKVE